MKINKLILMLSLATISTNMQISFGSEKDVLEPNTATSTQESKWKNKEAESLYNYIMEDSYYVYLSSIQNKIDQSIDLFLKHQNDTDIQYLLSGILYCEALSKKQGCYLASQLNEETIKIMFYNGYLNEELPYFYNIIKDTKEGEYFTKLVDSITDNEYIQWVKNFKEYIKSDLFTTVNLASVKQAISILEEQIINKKELNYYIIEVLANFVKNLATKKQAEYKDDPIAKEIVEFFGSNKDKNELIKEWHDYFQK